MLVRPLLCGYYGEHNIGDDALLQALLRALPAEAKPCITAADQQQVQQRFGVATCDRRRLRSSLSASVAAVSSSLVMPSLPMISTNNSTLSLAMSSPQRLPSITTLALLWLVRCLSRHPDTCTHLPQQQSAGLASLSRFHASSRGIIPPHG